MLKIECLKKGKNIIKGSSELKIMQNNHTPVLDLLVRESIQNSLDAKKDGVDTVLVNYLHSDFCVSDLCNELESIGNTLKNKHNYKNAKFLAIMDRNTVGLTGNLAGVYDIENKAKENLGKLVFHIMEEQDKEGAGGSWGIGKTLYYRIGIGLVVYYSRIQHNNGYQDRLVAAIVEDETKKDGLLSSIKGNIGVAWLGNINKDNVVEAVIDSEYIKEFLNIFNMRPMTGNQTGTYVIIPFINDVKLLTNNQKESSNSLWWEGNIEDYLNVSCLRWYFPRMSQKYNNGPKLKVTINGNEVSPNDNTAIYQKYMDMYNAFYDVNHKDWINVEVIERKRDLVTTSVGKFIYGLIDRDEIGLNHGLPTPNQYALVSDVESKYPLICYCRNAGMIVNYESFSRGVNIVDCPEDKYIIGIFVVDPENAIYNSPKNIKLDEYLRIGEKSDHGSWEDHHIPGKDKTLQIVNGIYKSIASCLNNKYGDNKTLEQDLALDISLARRYGQLFLPDAGFGTDPRKFGSSSGSRGGFVKEGKNKIKLLSTTFNKDFIELLYAISLNEVINSIIIDNKVNTINGKYSALDWEKEGLLYPCNIAIVGFQCFEENNKKVNEKPTIVDDKKVANFKGFDIIFNKTNTNKCYSLTLLNKTCKSSNLLFNVKLRIKTEDKLVQTCCDITFDRGV